MVITISLTNIKLKILRIKCFCKIIRNSALMGTRIIRIGISIKWRCFKEQVICPERDWSKGQGTMGVSWIIW